MCLKDVLCNEWQPALSAGRCVLPIEARSVVPVTILLVRVGTMRNEALDDVVVVVFAVLSLDLLGAAGANDVLEDGEGALAISDDHRWNGRSFDCLENGNQLRQERARDTDIAGAVLAVGRADPDAPSSASAP